MKYENKLRAEIKKFRHNNILNIDESCMLRMKWKLNSSLLNKSNLFKVLKDEKIKVDFNGIRDLDMCEEDFYLSLMQYKDKNKKLFNFVFRNLFRWNMFIVDF